MRHVIPSFVMKSISKFRNISKHNCYIFKLLQTALKLRRNADFGQKKTLIYLRPLISINTDILYKSNILKLKFLFFKFFVLFFKKIDMNFCSFLKKIDSELGGEPAAPGAGGRSLPRPVAGAGRLPPPVGAVGALFRSHS